MRNILCDRKTQRNGALAAQEPMARPFAAVATEVATVAAARLPPSGERLPTRTALTS